MISAKQFLAILEEKDLVPADLLGNLHRQIDESAVPISAALVAKRLVDAGLLSRLLAQRLLDKAENLPDRLLDASRGMFGDEGENEASPPPAAAPLAEEEIGLADDGETDSQEEDIGLAEATPPHRAIQASSQPRPTDNAPVVPSEDIEELEPYQAPVVPVDEIEVLPPAQRSKPDLPVRPAPTPRANVVQAAPLPAGEIVRPAPVVQAEEVRVVQEQRPRPAPVPLVPAPATDDQALADLDVPVVAPAPPRIAGTPPVIPVVPKPVAPRAPANPVRAPARQPDRLGNLSLDTAVQGAPLAAPPRKNWFSALFSSTRRRENLWDSPLLLIGGGGLLLIVLLGAVLAWAIFRRTGEEVLAAADKDYEAGSYTRAIDEYTQFLDGSPTGASASKARVRRGLARLRQATDGPSDWTKSLEVTREVLKEIKSEDHFATEARPELAAILPKLAQGLADQARKSPTPAAIVPLAQEALELVRANVPAASQPLTKLADIEASLALTSREIARDAELATALATIEKVAAAGKTPEAYKIRSALVKKYPVLLEHAALTRAILAVSQAERPLVKMVEKALAPLPDAPASPAALAAIPVRRLGGAVIAEAKSQVLGVMHEGVAYGLEASTGKLLWRRFVGHGDNGRSLPYPPTPVAPVPGSDLLLADAARQEILRVEATTGKARWRHPLGEPLDAHPVIAEDRLLVATRSGRLVIVDLATGRSPGHVQLPQSLSVAPALDASTNLAYQIGGHSNLYVLDLDKGQCRQVAYLGHDAASITVAPAVVGRYLLVAWGEGTEDGSLRVYALDPPKEESNTPSAKGAKKDAAEPPAAGPMRLLQTLPVKGHIDAPPLVAGNRVLLTTDAGQLVLLEFRGTDPARPLVEVGKRPASGEANLVRYPLLEGAALWVGDHQLTRYDFHASRGELEPKWVANEQSVTLQPLQNLGAAVVHVRRRLGLGGVSVSAISRDDGRMLWETQLGAPPAVDPTVNPAGQVTLVTAIGAVYRFPSTDSAAVLDQPAGAVDPASLEGAIDSVVALDKDRLGLASTGAAGKAFHLFDPANAKLPVQSFRLGDSLGGRLNVLTGRVVAPTAPGPVLLLDPTTARNATEPFLPRLESGIALQWLPSDRLGDELWIAESRGAMYRLAIKDQPRLQLAPVKEGSLGRRIVAPLAVLDKTVYAVDSAGTLVAVSAGDLTPGETWSLGGKPAWGPQRVGNRVMVATDEHLFCLGGAAQLLWKIPLPQGPLAGPPLEAGGEFVAAAAGGLVWRLAPDGKELGRLDSGIPWASGPVAVNDGLLLSARDGALYRVKKP